MAETKEWTLMFYFASDNPLAISIVSQLKAIKSAGFHPEANVIAQFDPFTEGTPTHIFDVNLINKLKNHGAPNIGFDGDDPIVRKLIEDKLWRKQLTRDGKQVSEVLKEVLKNDHLSYKPPLPPNGRSASPAAGSGGYQELDPQTSLKAFLSFCSEKYPARHYMLFILGHGVVVGNDVFLFDEHAEKHSLTLTDLGVVLGDFKNDVERDGGEFELISFHSCSVSSLEVAYQLKGTAKYMLASQGPSFVGSWPYRQILIRVFNDLVRLGSNIDIREMLERIFYYCLHNSADFLLAGYSFQLTLCDLTKISDLKVPVEMLSKALVEGLSDPSCIDHILLSHWKAQSFYQEMYTDLYDFCFCLSNRCNEITKSGQTLTAKLQTINNACSEVMDNLVKENPKKDRRQGDRPLKEQIIVCAEYAGPSYQYSRGLSVYFPWSQPSDDSRILRSYAEYDFHKDFEISWLTFLQTYFFATQRAPSREEPDERRFVPELTPVQILQEDIASLVYHEEGPLSGYSLAGPKTDPKDATGGDCDCPSIKNYPRDIRPRGDRRKQVRQPLPLGEMFFGS